MNFHMLRALLVCIVIVAPTSIVAAGQEPQDSMDCEAFAQHIRLEMKRVYPRIFKGWNNELWVHDAYDRNMEDVPGMGKPDIVYYQYACSNLNLHELPPLDLDTREKKLVDSSNIIALYLRKLKRCTETSSTPCPLSQETIKMLEEEQKLISRCVEDKNL